MTEAEWLSNNDVIKLLAHLNRPPDDRKLRLYAIACCRDVWDHLTEPASRDGIEWAERFADGLDSRDAEYTRLEKASMEVFAKYYREWSATPPDEVGWRGLNDLTEAVHLAWAVMNFERAKPYQSDLRRHEQLITSRHVYEVFVNPFRPVTFLAEWRTSTVLALAQQMYDSRDFSAMPLLAEALQNSGCEDEAVLTHCRGLGPHVRGCWVVDLILGKE
ncbi:hypothetical protein [Zavarzinella formosa]|uniref:hypothetical protein n=1 Tax=Zavarzinella formosa TaxID=360055 RepID=UPI00031C7430|nr:hypothetical protein [Zavarzinella formosa]